MNKNAQIKCKQLTQNDTKIHKNCKNKEKIIFFEFLGIIHI